jgi:putative ABC transport system permease protein
LAIYASGSRIANERRIIVQVIPILAALRRNKASAILVVLQVGLMLTFISNLVSIIAERASLVSRPTGTAESELFALGFRLPKADGTLPLLDADLQAIRSTPGVKDATATNAYPLRGSGWGEGISLVPGPTSIQQQTAQTAVYAMDQHGLTTLGLRLIEGRNFSADEVIAGQFNSGPMPSVAVVTQSLKEQLFGSQPALGRQIFVTSDSRKPVTVVGIVERLQSPYAAGTIDSHQSENSLILPISAAGGGGLFIVRVKGRSMNAVARTVQEVLIKNNSDRIFGAIRPFNEIRLRAYQKDRAIAVAFSILFVVLCLITALAIVGLTSFWVLRRTGQIGIRRALGATRLSIIRYFMIENALLCTTGAALGIAASLALNLWLRTHYGSDRISALALIACALMVVSLGQCAVMFPATRAARISPSSAFRSL